MEMVSIHSVTQLFFSHSYLFIHESTAAPTCLSERVNSVLKLHFSAMGYVTFLRTKSTTWFWMLRNIWFCVTFRICNLNLDLNFNLICSVFPQICSEDKACLEMCDYSSCCTVCFILHTTMEVPKQLWLNLGDSSVFLTCRSG